MNKPMGLMVLLLGALLVLGACGDDGNDEDGDPTNNATNNDTNNDTPNNDTNNDGNNDVNNDDPGACAACSEEQICVADACQDAVIPEPGGNVNTAADGDCGASTFAYVSGFVVDQFNRPVPGAKAQACVETVNAGLLCLMPADTDDNGGFEVILPDNARCSTDFAMRVLLPGDDKVTQYCHTELEDETVVKLTEGIFLYDTTRGTDAGGDDNTARAVTFADGLEIEVTPATLFDPVTDRLAAVALDADSPGLCFLEGQPTPDAVYGLSPETDILNDAYPIKVPNTKGLAPGTTVDFFVLGGLDCTLANGDKVGEAEWRQYGTGVVDGAGEFINSNEDGHLPCINWFGYKAR